MRQGAVRSVATICTLLLVTSGCTSSDDDAGTDVPTTVATADPADPDGSAAREPDSTEDATSNERNVSSAGPAGSETSAPDATTPEPATTAPTATSEDPPRTTTEDGVALPDTDVAEVLGPLGATEMDVDTGAGRVQIGSGDVPDAVPAEFPVQADLDVQLSTDIGDQAGFSGVSQFDFESLVAFYRDGFAALGLSVDEQLVDDRIAVLRFTGDIGRGEVAISSAPGGGRSVSVTFES